MTTVIINTRTAEAKKMVELLKTTRYAKVIEENEPNDETIEAIEAVEEGKVNSYSSAKELISSLKKKQVYKIKTTNRFEIELVHTGTHSDLFK